MDPMQKGTVSGLQVFNDIQMCDKNDDNEVE